MGYTGISIFHNVISPISQQLNQYGCVRRIWICRMFGAFPAQHKWADVKRFRKAEHLLRRRYSAAVKPIRDHLRGGADFLRQPDAAPFSRKAFVFVVANLPDQCHFTAL